MKPDTNDNLKKNVSGYYIGEDEFFDEAYEYIKSTYPMARQIVEHTCEVEKDVLFDGIDKAIDCLKKLKEEGYTRIEERWYGYEDNYIVAIKTELETDEEYYPRIASLVSGASKTIERREAQRRTAKKRINELEDEIRRIKKNIVC